MDPGFFKEQLAALADARRNNLTQVERVSSTFPSNHVLCSMANAMAIAMIYAQFEGFVKDVLQHYVEFVEAQGILQSDAVPCLVAYCWRPSFKKVRAKGHGAEVQFAEERVAALTTPLKFGKAERTIDTQANLKFKVLDGLTRTLGLDNSRLAPHSKKLDALVDKRNSIAHGDRAAKVSGIEVDEVLSCTQALIDLVELSLNDAVDQQAYRRNRESGVGSRLR